MYLLSENTEETFEFPNKSYVMIGSSGECDIRIDSPDIAAKHFAIIMEKFGLVAEVFDEPIRINNTQCREMCLLSAGDHITIGNDNFFIVDENKVPREVRPFKHKPNIKTEAAITSVYGLRAYSGAQNGEFIIPNQHVELENFILVNKKNLEVGNGETSLRLNGHKIACSRIANGDVISSKDYKYTVEFPGSSGFSKFSPSHPRNVLLSEKVDAITPEKPNKKRITTQHSFWRSHGWWITMLAGLVAIVAALAFNL
ncbi:FHA domain-containing protein [Marinicella sp. W31]|uniref:FHA domain-containing protein n=1 Tax=Marinicella sp. W31 TaxID=3023713 RepID=UPI0037573C86